MNKQYHLMTITKSHWDREWYMSYQKTRIKLIHLIDTLLEILDNDPEFVSFMMDAQTLPLEDYLEVKSYNRCRLEKYIQEGRIVIGPWYILPDEVLITGESHIRNYLMGTRIAKSFNAEKMQVGYLPDSFGHPSQMPQIIKKLGMNAIMFWRGATKEVKQNEFIWRAPDGTSVLAVLMPEGYSTGAELVNDPKLLARRFDEYIEKFAPRSTTDIIYLSNGGDHIEPSKHLSKLLKATNAQMKNGSITHTTLENFVYTLKSRMDESSLDEIKGELWGSNTAILLGSTLSTRTYLKQLNHKASALLENYLEPIWSLIATRGGKYPRDILVRAWKYLMENLPHDSICGCSIDTVHRDMLFRYNQVFEIGETLEEEAGIYFSDMDTSKIEAPYAVLLFNTFLQNRSDYVQVVLDVDARPTASSDYSSFDENGHFPIRIIDNSEEALKPLPISVRVFDGKKEIQAELIRASVENRMELGYEHFPHQFNVNRLVIGFLAENVPSMGCKIFGVEPIYEEKNNESPIFNGSISNEFFAISVEKDGTLTVKDIESSRILKGLNCLVDSGDCGDEYTYCPPDNDQLVFADPDSISVKLVAKNAVFSALEIHGIMHLPIDIENRFEKRSSETVDCTFNSRVTLYTGVRRIDIATNFENKAKNHRLRVQFPTGVLAQNSRSAGSFSVDERPVLPEIDPDAKEILTTYPQKDFCDADNGEFGLTIANRGLHEYEAFNEENQTVLAITLLRCTGLISQRKIKTRATKGGWSEKAPEAQCIGKWQFEYSIIPHGDTWENSGSYAEAHAFNFPMRGLQVPANHKSDSLIPDSLVRIDTPELIMTAMKQCEFEDAYILRMYNSTSHILETTLTFSSVIKKVFHANLREETLFDAGLKNGCIPLSVKPFEIVTLKLEI